MTVDWAKTSPWRRLPTRSATRKNPFFAYSDRLGERNETLRPRFAIYINCKSTVSSIRGCSVEFFSTARRAPAFSGDADAEARKFRRTSVRSDLLRAAAI